MEQKHGRASLHRGGERVGGTLAIRGRKLRFEPQAANARSEPAVIEISDIKRIRRTWTKVLGVVPVAPTAIELEMRNQERYGFTVSGRKAWIAALEEAHDATPR